MFYTLSGAKVVHFFENEQENGHFQLRGRARGAIGYRREVKGDEAMR